MTVKKIFKFIFKALLFIIAFLLIYLIIGFVLSRITVSEEKNTPDQLDIYILTNGVHTDIVMPAISTQKDWFNDINHLATPIDSLAYKYLAIGWGDKGFYLNTPSWAELKASTAIKAIFGLSGTAIHATYYKTMVESETCKKISISRAQYSRLIKYIMASLENDANGNVHKIQTKANKGDTDAFYEGTGRYSILYTCNSWANEGLKDSGQRACLWTAFQNAIFLKYE